MSEAINTGGAAFPCAMSEQSYSNQDGAPYQRGATLRDYFAAKAMQAQLTAFWALETHHGWSHAAIAQEAYSVADAMIRARDGGAA